MVGEDEEPELVGGSDVQDALEAEGSRGGVDFRGGLKVESAPGGLAIGIEVQEEANVCQRIVVEGQPGEGCVAAEVCVGALVEAVRGEEVGSEVFDEEAMTDIGPPVAGVGDGSMVEVVKGLLDGGGGGGEVGGFRGVGGRQEACGEEKGDQDLLDRGGELHPAKIYFAIIRFAGRRKKTG